MKKLQIRNSTAEFLIFTKQRKEKTIEVIVDEDTVWLSQKLMAELFGTTRNNITIHLKKILSMELNENSVCKYFLHTAEDGKNYNTKYYNLDVIIAIGFKINSKRAIEFRLWAINILKQYSVKGYVLDRERLENGTFLNKDYFF
ncbi:MAG: virulence RhuM family protein [Bacilli bacterium]|nr:virulence RhuM family protein [Bacilli bacterium]